jgi:hypothetical protein
MSPAPLIARETVHNIKKGRSCERPFSKMHQTLAQAAAETAIALTRAVRRETLRLAVFL